MDWLASLSYLCFGFWVAIGFGLLLQVIDRAVFSLLNAKKFGEKPDNLEEE